MPLYTAQYNTVTELHSSTPCIMQWFAFPMHHAGTNKGHTHPFQAVSLCMMLDACLPSQTSLHLPNPATRHPGISRTSGKCTAVPALPLEHSEAHIGHEAARTDEHHQYACTQTHAVLVKAQCVDGLLATCQRAVPTSLLQLSRSAVQGQPTQLIEGDAHVRVLHI